MGLYSTAMEAVAAYTGLSPAAFFTILSMTVVMYKVVCGMFVDPEDYSTAAASKDVDASPSFRPPSEPVQLGDVTEEQLRAYGGSDPSKPLLMAIKGQIYDVSPGRMFYGPGGPYALFAGRDASRALALLSFEPKDLTGNIEGLNESELEVLQDWEYKFMEKYVKVGQLVHEGARTRKEDEVQENKNQEDAEPK